ncbi:hypothetical protein [Eisenbergiella tayi]|uniref:Lipoprotein LipO n=1 Tax=Eisenbergiella tayi TaxID=1432052 RepID=A0A1E3AC81_9FIRM|nr:hypothetical protein [Eisenbergiella tayi]ODM05786.1 Lipoprotein LipO precursor [Eisenbergiella tayi]
MRNKKKVISIIVALAMTAASLTACGSGGKGAESAPAAAEGTGNTTAASTEAESSTTGSEESDADGYVGSGGTYTMYLHSTFVDWINDLEWYKEAEKRTGVTVEYQKGTSVENDVYTEVDQMVLSNTLTDSTMCKQDQANIYGAQGAFYDLKPLIDEYAPHIKAYLDANPDYESLVTNEDGSIYGLLVEGIQKGSFIFYRQDHFDKAGVDVSGIKTVDDFTEALRTLKAYYKDVPNYYPLNGRETPLRFQSLFNCNSNISAEESNGFYYNNVELGYDIHADGAYTMVETMKKWYDEGLINPEWIAGAFSEGDWEAAMWEGRGSISFDFYTRPAAFNLEGKNYDPDYNMAIMDFFNDTDGNPMKVQTDTRYNQKRATVINAKASEETAKTIIQFIDYFYSDEGQTLANWGVEGISYEEKDGQKEYIVSYDEELAKPDGEMEWSFLSDRFTICKPLDTTAFYSFNSEIVKDAALKLFTDEHLQYGINIIYSDEQSEELATLTASLKDSCDAGIIAFIRGTKELNEDNWKAFLDEMDAAGYTRMEELQLAAYQNTYND